MIQANELRLGNWVHHQKDKWSSLNDSMLLPMAFDFAWEDRHWYFVGECTLSLDIIDPIPLTEEWLTRFGFQKINIWTYEKGRLVVDVDLSVWIDSNSRHVDPIHLRKVKYVHQLQNMFYEIEEDELTISSDWDNLPFKD